jgi:predicted DNA binding CopG/RHH family protein
MIEDILGVVKMYTVEKKLAQYKQQLLNHVSRMGKTLKKKSLTIDVSEHDLETLKEILRRMQ